MTERSEHVAALMAGGDALRAKRRRAVATIAAVVFAVGGAGALVALQPDDDITIAARETTTSTDDTEAPDEAESTITTPTTAVLTTTVATASTSTTSSTVTTLKPKTTVTTQRVTTTTAPTTTATPTVAIAIALPAKAEAGYATPFRLTYTVPAGLGACGTQFRVVGGAWPAQPSCAASCKSGHGPTAVSVEPSRHFDVAGRQRIEVRAFTSADCREPMNEHRTAANVDITSPGGPPPSPGAPVEGVSGDWTELQDALDAAIDQWEGAASDYRFRARRLDFRKGFPPTQFVDVNASGSVTSSVDSFGASTSAFPVTARFAEIQRLIDADVAAVTVRFDTDLGFPASIVVDPQAGVADDGYTDAVEWLRT